MRNFRNPTCDDFAVDRLLTPHCDPTWAGFQLNEFSRLYVTRKRGTSCMRRLACHFDTYNVHVGLARTPIVCAKCMQPIQSIRIQRPLTTASWDMQERNVCRFLSAWKVSIARAIQ